MWRHHTLTTNEPGNDPSKHRHRLVQEWGLRGPRPLRSTSDLRRIPAIQHSTGATREGNRVTGQVRVLCTCTLAEILEFLPQFRLDAHIQIQTRGAKASTV